MTMATNYDSFQHITYNATLKEGKALSLIVDTGLQKYLIKKSTLCYIYPKAVIKPTSITIVGITGHSLQVLGKWLRSDTERSYSNTLCSFQTS